MILKALIIDDEVNGADSLFLLIKNFFPEVEVISKAYSGKEGILKIAKYQPDIVFLDIQMPHMNGFEMLSEIANINFHTIFTTAHDDYALKAFKVNATDYLLKPVEIDDLRNAIGKVKSRIRTNSYADVEAIIKSIRKNENELEKLPVSGSEGIIFILVDEIIYLSADSNYTNIFTVNGKKFTEAKTLKEFENTLPASKFMRVHHASLINVKFIEKYVKGDGGYVVMKDGSMVKVSRRKKAEFLERMGL